MTGEFPPEAIEVLTGSPFGMQFEDSGLAFFDPPGWNPDLGLDAAIELMGWTCERSEGGTPGEALERLRAACADGPVLVGPVDIGLLTHQPWAAGTAIGGDHWVVVLEVGDTVVMHDPEGFPYATLPIDQFVQSWRAEKLACAGPYVLRTGFRRLREVAVEDALRASIPRAVEWLSKDSATHALRLAAQLEDGIDVQLLQMLGGFILRSGARRLDDAGTWLERIGAEAAARISRGQARLLGRAQFPLVRGELFAAAEIIREFAPGYARMHATLK
ncbi:hypothetical protein AB0E69_21150 [Kribbella sp. NPDC026611]|uniref:hypothetical protein n=1 Tax=Kribbella sp. NPDC026611 TaxID=3154911 RepID=UPI00340CA210